MRALLKMALALLPGQTSDIARIAYDCLPPGLRYGRAYRQAIALLERSERWTLPELQAYQRRRLDPLLLHCLENVPYYTRAFGELGVDAAAIKAGLDISGLPLLTKDDVRRNKAELRARNIPFRRCEPANTGGSTGDPLDFTLDLDARAMERALTLRQLRWLGYEKGDVIAEIKADAFADPARLFRYFPCSKQVRFSFLSADDAKLAATVAALERFRPAFIKAYPSALALLAGWLGRHKRRIPPPRFVLSSSENLYPAVKDAIEAAFGAKVIDHYGQNEQVATAFQCAEAGGYHVQMEQCLVEFLPARDGACEIVGTSLQNYAMPFLRYRTSDLALPATAPCPCGRAHPMFEGVVGRHEDVIITPEHRFLTPLVLDYGFHNLEDIKEAQIIQEDLHTLRILLVPWEQLNSGTPQRITAALAEHLGETSLRVVIEETEHIPWTKRGKRPFILSRLKPDDYM